MKRGEIYLAELPKGMGSEQSGLRPVVVIQNDCGNKYSPTTIVAVITSKRKADIPTHVPLSAEKYNLKYDSTILAEQLFTLDKKRLHTKISSLDLEDIAWLNEALRTSIWL